MSSTNRNPDLNDEAIRLLSWWESNRFELKDKLRTLRKKHRDDLAWWREVMDHPDTPAKMRDKVNAQMGKKGSEWRSDVADRMWCQRNDVFRKCDDLPLGAPTVARLSELARSAQRHARGTARRTGEWDTEYYSACGHDDYLLECADEARNISRAALRLARLVKDGMLKEAQAC